MMNGLPAWMRSTEAIVAGVLILTMIVIGLVNPQFWSMGFQFGLMRSSVVIGLMALGVMLVMISGGIDVSFPAFAIAGSYLVIRAMGDWQLQARLLEVWPGAPLWLLVVLPLIAAIAIGAVLGLMNALIIHHLRMIPLIVTLGTAAIVGGLVRGQVGTSNVNVGNMPRPLMEFAGTNVTTVTNAAGGTVGLTAMLPLFLGIALILHLVLAHTMTGRAVYAYGAAPDSARRVGFRTGRTLIFTYVTAGALAGLAGIVHASMNRLANPRDFSGWELDVIAAVVLGGASIFGGRGSVLGTLLGVYILVMIKGSLILMGVPQTWQQVVVGAMLIAAVALTALRDRKAQG